MMSNDQALLSAFLNGEIDNRNFHHTEHVRVGFELLRDRNFCDALAAFSGALKRIATRAGNPGAYHETITVAFLALIAEHCASGQYSDFETFARDNPKLLDKSVLERWYTPERLASPIARQTFVLPEPLR
jgi:hypothetical protein